MKNNLTENFSKDDILYGKLKLWQPLNGPRVNLDTILLSAWVRKKSGNSNFLELGCATGAISFLLALKFKNNFKITGLEIQKELFELAKINKNMNNFDERVNFVHGDLRDKNIFKNNSFDVVIINPPYESIKRGRESKNQSSSIARLEVTCTLEDVSEAASRFLKSKGRFFAIFNTERLDVFLNAMIANKIIPKRIRFIHPKENSDSNVFLVECIKDGGEGLIIHKPLFIYNSNGNYTDEVLNAYSPEGYI